MALFQNALSANPKIAIAMPSSRRCFRNEIFINMYIYTHNIYICEKFFR